MYKRKIPFASAAHEFIVGEEEKDLINRIYVREQYLMSEYGILMSEEEKAGYKFNPSDIDFSRYSYTYRCLVETLGGEAIKKIIKKEFSIFGLDKIPGLESLFLNGVKNQRY